MFNVSDKIAFITGGTAGIGLATASRLSEAGANVTILGRREAGSDTARDIGARFIRTDVTVEAELIAALDAVRNDHGPIDLIFNNAGIENSGPTIEESDVAEFQRLIEIDLKAPYNVIRHGATRMRDGGSIVNTSSTAGLTQLPGYSQYSAVKAALISLTRSAALELAPRGIRVNAICPGSVWSEMLPQDHPEVEIVKVLCPGERIGEPEEVAALVHFLAADDCRYLTGAAIPIDGGLLSGFGYPLLEKVLS
jgi:NAD(P)-dependent dehydrogenase (short-subunit alcohol dehydrogenase family)